MKKNKLKPANTMIVSVNLDIMTLPQLLEMKKATDKYVKWRRSTATSAAGQKDE